LAIHTWKKQTFMTVNYITSITQLYNLIFPANSGNRQPTEKGAAAALEGSSQNFKKADAKAQADDKPANPPKKHKIMLGP